MDLSSVVRDALAAHLAPLVAEDVPGVVVSGTWPDPGKPLPSAAVTVLVAGDGSTRGHAAAVRATTPTTGTLANVRYTFARVEIPLQLDCWATFSATRDQLAVAVEKRLNRHPAETLGVVTWPRLNRRSGLVLKPAALLGCPVEFRFGARSTPVESSEAAQGGEWRATWSGAAHTFAVTEEEARILREILLDATVGTSDAPIIVR